MKWLVDYLVVIWIKLVNLDLECQFWVEIGGFFVINWFNLVKIWVEIGEFFKVIIWINLVNLDLN